MILQRSIKKDAATVFMRSRLGELRAEERRRVIHACIHKSVYCIAIILHLFLRCSDKVLALDTYL